ncbi:MAG TPA: HAMP domain-containing histidine kinase [Bacteroidetes bacterium]|nr:HAMP domain-containing histidine kinase [Bacteroidota bacterium]
MTQVAGVAAMDAAVFTSSDRLRRLEKELRAARRELKRKDKELAAKEEELQALFYTVSHELKTPLISLRGFSSLLQEFHAGSLSQEGRNYLDRIVRNVDQMEQLINSLLVFSRIRVGYEEMEPVDVKELLEESIWELQYLIRETGGRVEAATELPVVYGNRNQLLTVFVNLIGNGLKYARQDVTPLVQVGYAGDEIFHKFWVRDNGVGIPPRGRERLFKMFSRLGNKGGVEGSGLGLAIVKRVVENHGGEVWVRSRRNVGSCFYFTLARRPGRVTRTVTRERGEGK